MKQQRRARERINGEGSGRAPSVFLAIVVIEVVLGRRDWAACRYIAPSAGSRSARGPDALSTSGKNGSPARENRSEPIHACPNGGSTTISGTIYDPAGKRPLYGVVAYVPSSTPAAFTPGVSCSSCADLYTGHAVASAVSDTAGNFTITDAPDGLDIPLVVQIGKWRRQFVLPSVPPCANTTVPNGTLTLPRNGMEGDLPNIAISTGGGDSIECFLRRIGVDASEYVPGAGGSGHVHIFRGHSTPDSVAPDMSVGAPASAVSLWGSLADMMPYDMVLLSCEAYAPPTINPQVLFDYAAAGGRVYASHMHYAWFATGPFGAANLATWTTGQQRGDPGLGATIVTTTWDEDPFARGQAFHDWLYTVGALADTKLHTQLQLEAPPHDNAYLSAANTASQPWIVASSRPGVAVAFSFATPLGAPPDKQCGRVVFSDMHVGGAQDYPTEPGITPSGCGNNDLRPQEKALEFMLFELASCVTPANAPEEPPTN